VAPVGWPITSQYLSSSRSPAQTPADWSDGKSSRSMLLAAVAVPEGWPPGSATRSVGPVAAPWSMELASREQPFSGSMQMKHSCTSPPAL